MKRSANWSAVWLFALAMLGACAGLPEDAAEESDVLVTEQALAGDGARGVVPPGLPARVMVGLFEDTGSRWMTTSGVRWDARYRYFSKGWINNWGYGAYDGSWGLAYMRECDQQGYTPAVQYYQLFAEPGGGEAQTLSKLQNAATMRSYFGDFKILMQRAKDFGKPVMILLEADAYGFVQQQSGSNPNAYAAIAASGMPELANLPNTVAGWGLAFLQIKKAVGATNAILGMHISAWASDKDLAYSSVTDPLAPEVDKVYNFLSPLGLGANATGTTYDVLVGDPLDRDSDYYRIALGQERWWDASDGASISAKSFNRYAEWLRLWNQKASKRWVLWQIPLGNSNHLNVYNNGASRQGYKDNRPEYFFANGTAHISKFADAGVIALLFGGGTGGMSGYTNDTYSDGQLFMKSRAGAILNAGGVPINTGGSTTPPPPPPPPTSGVQYNFESDAQGFTRTGSALTSVASSTDRAFLGSRSLKLNIRGSAGTQRAYVQSPAAPAGANISFRVYLPAGSAVASVQPYVLQGAAGGWQWTGSWRSAGSLTAGQWNTINLTVPTSARVPLQELGVEITTNATWTGALYVDAIGW